MNLKHGMFTSAIVCANGLDGLDMNGRGPLGVVGVTARSITSQGALGAEKRRYMQGSGSAWPSTTTGYGSFLVAWLVAAEPLPKR